MNTEKLKKILESHAAWSRGESIGKRACLRGSDLRGAYLSGSDLREADLRGSDLREADLRDADLRDADLRGSDLSGAYLNGACMAESIGLTHASVAWPGHGACGRQLLCVITDGVPMYFCGCFSGTADELNEYIDADVTQPEKVTQSRRKALWIVSDLILEVEP